MSEIISDLIGCFFLVLIGILFGYLISDVKFSKKKKYFIVITTLLYTVGYNLIYHFIDNSLRSVINFAINTLIFKFLFDFKFAKAIFISFLHGAILLISDIVSLLMTMYLLPVDESFMQQNMVGGILGNLMVSVIFIVFALILRKPLKKLLSLKITYNKMLSFYIVLTVICVYGFFFFAFGNIELSQNLFVGIFAIIVFLIILFSLIKQKVKNENITKEYDNLVEFVKEYEVIIEEQRIAQHENKNMLVNIKSKIIDKSNNKDIVEYIDSLLNEKTSFDKAKYAKLGYLPANGLKGLFYYKINKAESLGIKVSISISKNIENSLLYEINNNNYKDLCKILGVYLDNAMEASVISDSKLLGLEIYNRGDYVTIIISNSYCGEVDKDRVNNLGYSTKGSGRGYGLSLVKRIIKNSDIFESDTKVNNELYIQRLNIKKSN